MKVLIFLSLIIFSSSCMQAQKLKTDFGSHKQGQNWQIINDGVMGGLSQGRAIFKENSVIFQGSLSLENNGGFASYRTPFAKMDLSKFEKVKIKVKGKGGKFTLMFETSARFYEPYFKYELIPKDEWQVFECKLKDLEERILLNDTGRFITKEELSKIIRFGIIKSDKKTGEFELAIDYIEFE